MKPLIVTIDNDFTPYYIDKLVKVIIKGRSCIKVIVKMLEEKEEIILKDEITNSFEFEISKPKTKQVFKSQLNIIKPPTFYYWFFGLHWLVKKIRGASLLPYQSYIGVNYCKILKRKQLKHL